MTNVLITLESAFEVTPVGLVVTGQPSFEAWQRAGQVLVAMHGASGWCIGDWILQGEYRFGEMYTQALDATTYTKQSLADMVWVCRCWPIERRRADLSFQHHRVCAPMPTWLQDTFMTLAADTPLSANRLSGVIKRFMDGETLEQIMESLDEPTVITPGQRLPHPKLVCNTTAKVQRMGDDEISLAIRDLPAAYLKPGVEVFVKIVTLQPEDI